VLLCYSVPLALAAVRMLTVIAAVFLATVCGNLRWSRKLTELGKQVNNQAFQTLRGAKLRSPRPAERA